MHDFSMPGDSDTIDGLQFVWLEITEKCNLQCTHCYADSGPSGSLEGEMRFHDWLRVIDEAADLGCYRLQFIGGEPTLHPHLKEMLTYAREKRFEFIEVYTNATRLGGELIKSFCTNQVHVATSFYSREPSVHERVTLGKGSWHHTVKGIQNAINANLSLSVSIVQTGENDDSDSTIAFLKDLGVTQIGVDRQRKVGRGGSIVSTESVLGERYHELCGQCWKQRLCVTANSAVYPCVFSRATLLGSAKEGLHNICRSARLAHFRRKVRDIERERAEIIAQEKCAPNVPCGPHTCPPETKCPPQIMCGPDKTCGPNYVQSRNPVAALPNR